MKVAHLLRKYNPAEWGGTETAVKRLLDGLREQRVQAVLFCPRIHGVISNDPFAEAGHDIRRFKAFLPVWRLSLEQREQLIAVGGNLLSLSLIRDLWREPELDLIHTHAINRLGGIALTVAHLRKVPLVVTVHGGVLDLPRTVRDNLIKPLEGGIEWGKLLGLFLRSRRVLEQADAVLTCNRREAALLARKYPGKRILVQPHAVDLPRYQIDYRERVRNAFPILAGRKALLTLGRLDPVKNQAWLISQLPQMLARYPDLILVLAGACTDAAYGKFLKKEIRGLGLDQHVLLTGGLPPEDPRLIGLLQSAQMVLVPSHSETFGLVILEAWAAGRPVLATRTSGALELVRQRENGWFFDLEQPDTFHQAVREILAEPDRAARSAENGRQLVRDHHDSRLLARRVRCLYEELIEEKRP